MSELQFSPMDDRAISQFSSLTDIIEQLREVAVTIVGIRQYASSTDGKIANRQIMVGASYENAQTKDLKALLRMSPSCSDPDRALTIARDNKYHSTFISASSKDRELMEIITSRINVLKAPDFSEYYTRGVDDPNVFYTAWVEVINSIVNPQANRSAGQSNAYVQVCTGVYQHTENQDRYYIKGYELSSQILAPAINPRNSSSNPLVIAKNAIKFGLDLMMTKYRTLHLREDDTRLRLNGTELSIAMTSAKIREVRATNQAKADAKIAKAKAKEDAKKAKETATKE